MDPAQLPAEVRSRFLELSSQMTRVSPQRGESAICATVRKMSNEEAGECAQHIVEILTAIGEPRDLAQQPRPRKVLSLYAAEA
jgi:hypothetical protein